MAGRGYVGTEWPRVVTDCGGRSGAGRISRLVSSDVQQARAGQSRAEQRAERQLAGAWTGAGVRNMRKVRSKSHRRPLLPCKARGFRDRVISVTVTTSAAVHSSCRRRRADRNQTLHTRLICHSHVDFSLPNVTCAMAQLTGCGPAYPSPYHRIDVRITCWGAARAVVARPEEVNSAQSSASSLVGKSSLGILTVAHCS